MNSHRNENPVLITSAAPSYEDQLSARRRRYALMMSLRIPCILLALLFAKIWWLALILILLSVPLPWMAVLIANDRPPRKAESPQRLRPSRSALTAGDDEESR
ncbi:DUF3099 domain-containing protein [Lentzea sp. BCCO 10_0061]|uniref:DUF3099 domain-containing protein n=1 Tax=Lentzea sokolovensis TaxID=3095429 RepID=A0ABU4V640_9PSEU|nr:DUF3099 domain-containing protein [Lentzea sp. BCCO 10_0061]MDX8147250.1 DUF3099 domain-containing protein [Lentzea sp. BCCO 10_0061]